jgi:hypothetical protein
MSGPENVTPELCDKYGRLAFAKAMEKIADEIGKPNPDPALLEALASCGSAACADFGGSP